MEYTQFEITVASDYEDIICAFLIKAGSPSVAVDDPSLVPPKEGCIDKREEIPEQTGNVMITADFDSDIPDIENIVKDFLSNLSICHELKISKLEKKDWNLEWKKHFKGIEIENLLKIVPPWQEITGTSLINVIINPGEGFGTGTHVTTNMCLSAMKDIDFSGKKVFDAGCGSGIIGICAKLLGADEIVMTDYDLPSIENAKENIKLNGIRNGISIYKSDLSKEKVKDLDKFDIVFANIILNVNKDFVTLNKGRFAEHSSVYFTGILTDQLKGFEAFLEKNSFAIEQITTSGDWCLFKAKEI